MNKLLIKAVVEQLGYNSVHYDILDNEGCIIYEEDLEDTLIDIVSDGAACGWSGFTYYSDTTQFARDNMLLIKEQLEILSSELGIGMLEMVTGFTCLNNNCTLEEVAQTIYGQHGREEILNALAWFALEEVARYLVEN